MVNSDLKLSIAFSLSVTLSCCLNDIICQKKISILSTYALNISRSAMNSATRPNSPVLVILYPTTQTALPQTLHCWYLRKFVLTSLPKCNKVIKLHDSTLQTRHITHVLRARRDYKLTLLSAPRLASRGTNLVCLMKSFMFGLGLRNCIH